MAKDKYQNPSDRRMIAFAHLEDYLQTFIQRWATPTGPLDLLSRALEEEVSIERMRLYAQRVDGLPRIRRQKPKESR